VERLEIRPVTAGIGAEVRGVDLGAELDPETIAALRRALLEHVVLFFRDQKLTPARHVALARRFGEISPAPFGRTLAGFSEITVLDQTTPKGEGADSWHTDNTFMEAPPMGSILRAVELPPLGGDTCFANMVAAYEALSAPLRSLLETLRAEHDLTKTLTLAIRDGHSQANLAEMQRLFPPVSHPVVRTHPETKRRLLFVNGNHTTRLLGLSERENQALLPFLIDHVRAPEFQCRFRWEPGSVAFWDNRSAQHYGVPDYSARRIMHRVTLAGDRPV
jgi:taurine dioxygenase